MVSAPPQQFCVRWNSYQTNLQNAFPKLLTSERFVDVTLACENEMLKCHKVVLSACSTYFEKLLLDNPCRHPIIFMKDMKFSEMQSLVDFMYKGEVNVTQDDLPSLLKSAEALQIRGLCGSDQLLGSHYFQQAQQKLLVAQSSLMTAATEHQTAGAVDGRQTPLSTKSQPQDSPIEQLKPQPSQVSTPKAGEAPVKKEVGADAGSEGGNAPSSPECDSNDGMLQIKEDLDDGDDDAYFDGDGESLLDQEMMEEDGPVNTCGATPVDHLVSPMMKTPTSTMATVGGPHPPHFVLTNMPFDPTGGGPGSASSKRIRRSDEELRRAAECITRGQTFQTVSDQFNIPISTIRFYMARKGILPRRKRGRSCAGPMSMTLPMTSYPSPGSPIGPPYHIVHYKLPALGVSKLK